jgi:hypothetical protein
LGRKLLELVPINKSLKDLNLEASASTQTKVMNLTQDNLGSSLQMILMP